MPTIAKLLENYPGSTRWVENLAYDPEVVEALFEPLHQAGFTDFEWAGFGGNSFCIAPVGVHDYVFRITDENLERPNNSPFFFQPGYQHEVSKGYGNDVELEMLLAGKAVEFTSEQKKFLLDEMIAAGWSPEILSKEAIWKDVLHLSMRTKDGRLKTVPMITDPSVRELIDLARVKTPNSCSRDYISLQEQADRFNALRESDERLKNLIPEPVVFPKTEIRASGRDVIQL